jgi:hypothetical protein
MAFEFVDDISKKEVNPSLSVIILQKSCTKCKKLKACSDFHKDRTQQDGLYSSCKECKSLYGLRIQKVFSPSRLFKQYRANAKHSDRLFNLTINDFAQLEKLECYYCGENTKILGYDRVDNNIGYLKSNIVPCCDICNYMKSDLATEQWVKHIERVLIRHKERQ